MEHNPPGVFSASKKDGTIYYRASITHKKSTSAWAVILLHFLPMVLILKVPLFLMVKVLPSQIIHATASFRLPNGSV